MSNIRIAQRYAKSLLNAAIDQKAADAVSMDMQLLLDLVKENETFSAVLRSPIIAPEKKANLLKGTFGSKMHALSINFFNTVVEKGREVFLPEMANSYLSQYNEVKGLTKATLTTAVEPGKEMISKVEKLLLDKAGLKEVELDVVVNPSIMGGFILKYKDKLYDDSIATRMRELKSEFKKNTYVKKYRH